MTGKALLIGNSDGIGLAVTRELLERGWEVFGISRSGSSIENRSYQHFVIDVRDEQYPATLDSILETGGAVDLCIFCAGVGELLDLANMEREAGIFDVNLVAMVKAAARVIPGMVRRGNGHFIGLSSVADELLSPEAPSYHASKAGFSRYLEGLALALRPKGIYVTNVRFGFVDTKMAKGKIKPFMMGVDRAARHLLKCIDKKPVRYTAPLAVVPLVKLRGWALRLSTILPNKR